MRTRLLNLWERLTTNYWLIPAVMAAGAIAFALLTIHWDAQWTREDLSGMNWIWLGSAEGARAVLSTIAASMITVAGVTFSITIVALAQASSQFGPLLLRNFMRDVGNQLVLGTFIATFIYCLLILRTVHDGSNLETSVPHFSVTCGIVFAVASLAVLIYFIHHVCEALQAENLVARIGNQLERIILREFPDPLDDNTPKQPRAAELHMDTEKFREIHATASGYLQAIDLEALVRIAASHDTRFALQRDPGDFVAEGNTLLLCPEEVRLGEDTWGKIRGAFLLGRHRTPTQDPDYAIHQLVEVAVRALSPAMNDPFTAVTCVDWLGAALNVAVRRNPPSGCLRDQEANLRVFYKAPSFSRMLDAAFNQIRQSASANAAVSIRLLETLAHVARRAQRPGDLQAIAGHAARILADCEHGIENAWDLALIQDLGRKVFCLTDERINDPSTRLPVSSRS